MQFAQTHTACLGTDHACPTADLARKGGAKHAKANPAHNAVGPTTVVTLSKSIHASSRLHPHYAASRSMPTAPSSKWQSRARSYVKVAP